MLPAGLQHVGSNRLCFRFNRTLVLENQNRPAQRDHFWLFPVNKNSPQLRFCAPLPAHSRPPRSVPCCKVGHCPQEMNFKKVMIKKEKKKLKSSPWCKAHKEVQRCHEVFVLTCDAAARSGQRFRESDVSGSLLGRGERSIIKVLQPDL